MDENSEIKATLVSPPADVHAPHSLKDERESFGHKLGEVLSSSASNALLGTDVPSLFRRSNPDISKNDSGSAPLRSFGGMPFSSEREATSLRSQPFSPQAAGKLEGENIVKAIEKSTMTLIGGINALGHSLNSIVLSQNIINSSLTKSNSLLNNISGQISKSNLFLQNLSDDLDREKYLNEQQVEKPNIGGGSEPREVGPSKAEEKHEGLDFKDLLKGLLAEDALVKAGGVIAGGFISAFSVALPEIIAIALNPVTIGAAVAYYLGNSYNEAHKDVKPVPFDAIGNQSWQDYFTGRSITDPKENAEDTLENKRKEDEAKKNRKPHSLWDTFQREFGVAPAEGAELDQQLRQPKHLKHEGRNKLGHHGKELKVEGDLKVSPEKDIAINAKEAKNVTILVGSEAIAKIVKDTIAGMILGGAAGSVLPGPGTLAGMGVGGATGLAMNSGILSKLTGKDFEEFKKKFKEGLEKGEMINTPSERGADRKRFMSGPLQNMIERLNGGSATRPGSPRNAWGNTPDVDVNNPGLYTGPGMSTPQGIGGMESIGRHFGVGGIAMPQTPGGLGVKGIGGGVQGGGPAFQQQGLSGGPITVQPRQGPPTGRGSGTHAKGNLAANQSEAYNAAIAEGLSPTAAKALVANMSGESLSNPHLVKKDYNSRGQFVHMAHGIVQWDDVRSSAIEKEFHKTPEQMSVAEQTKAAIWEMKTKYPTAWKALKEGNDPQAMIHSLVHDYEMPADKAKAIGQRMGFYRGLSPDIGKQKEAQADKPSKGESRSKGEDPKNMKARPGETVDEMASRIKQMAPHMESEQCVALAKAAVNAPGSTKDWRRGEQVKGKDIPIGTPIATFMDPHGKPSEQYAGGTGGKAGANRDHAGVFAGYEYDKNGKEIGYKIDEQYKGSGGPHIKSYRYGDKRGGEKDADNYYTINNKEGEPLGDKKLNPMWNKKEVKQEVHASIDFGKGGSSGGAGASGGWVPINEKNEEKFHAEMTKPSLGSLSSKYEGKVGTAGGDHGRAYGKYQFDYKAKGLQTFFKENPEYAKHFHGLKPGSHAFNEKWKQLARSDPKGFEAAQDKAAKARWYDPAEKHAEGLGFHTENRGIQEAIFSGSIQHGHINQIENMAAKNPNFKNMSAEQQLHAFYNARSEYVRQHSHLHGSRLAGVLNRYKREEPDAVRYARSSPSHEHLEASRDIITRGERGGASPHSPPSPVTRAPAMLHTPRGEQAHGLTPTHHRDPEMSRHIPAHNQPLHEMSAGRAAAHERNNKQRQKTGAHAGSGTNHAPPSTEGKHSTMPYGDMGHFDLGTRDRFLSMYLDGHG